MKKRSVVLLSGGLDSVANFYAALRDPSRQVALALTLDYGQKSAQREKQVAQWHCKQNKIEHKVLKTELFKKNSQAGILKGSHSLPLGDQLDIECLSTSQSSANSVWVPNRNGIFLNLAAFYAEITDAQSVLIGFNKEEAETFPDNSAAFLQAANDFFSYSTRNQVDVFSYTLELNKQEIIKKYGPLFDLHTLWPCYQNQKQWCGECESCHRFKRAMRLNQHQWEAYLAQNQAFIASL